MPSHQANALSRALRVRSSLRMVPRLSLRLDGAGWYPERMQEFVAVVLAAGQGTRMKSSLPKVLHRIAGRSMVAWSVGAALDAGVKECVVVVGHGREQVEADLSARFGERVRFAVQEEQLGTGHAVRCAVEQGLEGFGGSVLVLYGDCPLVRTETLRRLMESQGDAPLALLTAQLEDPTGYGRILRDDGSVVGIREQKDCTPEERAITEVNPGMYAIDGAFLGDALGQLDTDNAQGELYLTDLVEIAAKKGRAVDVPGDMKELGGVNDRLQLADAATAMQRRVTAAYAREGVGITDVRHTWIDADCELAPDCTIEPGVHLRGRCVVEAGARVDVGSVLTDVRVEAGAYVKPYTVAAESRIGPRAQIGPFAHLRPATDLGEDTKVGNFCETKKTVVGAGSKVNHLAYVGDGVIGEGVNVGAGTIFCNYDGVQKHTTTLKDGVFIGSDSQLIAPVTIGEGAYVASGSSINKDVPAGALAISRTKQVNKEGYADRLRARMKALKKAKAEDSS